MVINPASYSTPGASHPVAVSPNTVPQCDATVQSHSDSSVSNRRDSDSRRDLLDIRSSNPTPILRHVRKALFQSFLWSPHTPSPAGIDSRSPRDCDADLVSHPPVGCPKPGLSRESITTETYQIELINCMSQPSYDTRGHSDFSDRSIDPVLTNLRHCRSKPKRCPPLVTPVPKNDSYHNMKPPRRVHVCLFKLSFCQQ